MITVTLSLDTAAYASGDLLADTQEVAGFAADTGSSRARLDSLTVIDEDDQGVAFQVYFLGANVSLGTENAAPNISDANARNILGWVPVATTDYKDLGGVRIATVRNIGLILQATPSLYLAVMNDTGTPTFTASGVKLLLGFSRV